MARLFSKQTSLDIRHPLAMGILNVTPDSFSDGSAYLQLEHALKRAEQMVTEGVAIIDIGGESTRPGAQPISVAEEMDRVLPVVEALAQRFDVWLSVDTSQPALMTAAAAAGAHMINDVRAFNRKGALAAAAASGLALCFMHMQGEPDLMQQHPCYQNVVDEVYLYLARRIQAASEAGVASNKLLVDPGFGFGKTVEHNVKLLAKLERFQTLGLPILVGLSRKSMIGALLAGAPVHQRLEAGVAAATIAAMKGAKIIRTHDVKATVDALTVVSATKAYCVGRIKA